MDALREAASGRHCSSGSCSGRLVRERQPAPVPPGQGEMGARGGRSGTEPRGHRACAGPRWEAPGGRGAGPGGARGCPGRGERPWGSGESPALRQADFHQAASPSAVPPSSQPGAGVVKAPLPLGRLFLSAVGWGCPISLGGTSERERGFVVSVWLQPCWGQ